MILHCELKLEKLTFENEQDFHTLFCGIILQSFTFRQLNETRKSPDREIISTKLDKVSNKKYIQSYLGLQNVQTINITS